MNDARDDTPRSIHQAIDALFDGELDDARARRLLADADPAACEDVAKTQRIISMLKRPVGAPDLTDAILARVEDEREFLPSPWRRLVRVGRVAVAASLLLGLVGVALAHRYWPEQTAWSTEPRPVSALLNATEREAGAGVQQIEGRIELVADAQKQFAGQIMVAVDAARPGPSKVDAGARHVATFTVAPRDVRLVEVPSSVVLVGAGSPGIIADPMTLPCSSDPTGPRFTCAPGFGSSVSVQAGLLSVWSADTRAPQLPRSVTLDRRAAPYLPGVTTSKSTIHELP